MYAITNSGFRAVTPEMSLAPGESRVSQIPEALAVKVAADQRRVERDELLRATDWTQMADAPLTAAQKTAMSVYRQALRDLPSLPGFPDITWPTLPQLSGAAGDIKAPM